MSRSRGNCSYYWFGNNFALFHKISVFKEIPQKTQHAALRCFNYPFKPNDLLKPTIFLWAQLIFRLESKKPKLQFMLSILKNQFSLTCHSEGVRAVSFVHDYPLR